MPIGSKSYYDALDPSINHPEPKLAMFRRNDGADTRNGKAPKSKQAEPEPTAAPAAAQHIDAVVTQIIELATRTASVLQRAEEMARRAEEIFCSVLDTAQRAEAAAMRAELAASRTELNVITGAPGFEEIAEEEVDEERAHELEMVAQITEKLRNGIAQMEGLTSGYQEPEQVVDTPAALEIVEQPSEAADPRDIPPAFAEAVETPTVFGIRSDFDHEPSFTRSASRNTSTPNPSDALARSLVSVCHDTGMPRVSPYIIQVPTASDSDYSTRSNGHDGPVNIAV